MAVYLKSLDLLSDGQEINFITDLKQTCYNSVYPYKLFPVKGLGTIDFAPITVFYGGNGSGKSTLLNIIAEKVKVERHSVFGGSAFFETYVKGCDMVMGELPLNKQIITSDDVTDYLLHLRSLNRGIDRHRESLFDDYLDRKYASYRLTSLEAYDDWKESFDSKFKTQSQFVRDRLMQNVAMHSNGESAMLYFMERITENGLYLLDEPENSLSIALQMELKTFLEESARFFGCQIILSTHSPILLSINGASILDLDEMPPKVKPWTALENVRKYFEFFESHRGDFGIF